MLTVTQGVPPAATCGIPRPPGAGDRQPPDPGRRPQDRLDLGCPLVIDLYRDSQRVIDGVVIYSAVDPP